MLPKSQPRTGHTLVTKISTPERTHARNGHKHTLVKMLRKFPVDLSVPAPPKLPRGVRGQPRPGCALWQAVWWPQCSGGAGGVLCVCGVGSGVHPCLIHRLLCMSSVVPQIILSLAPPSPVSRLPSPSVACPTRGQRTEIRHKHAPPRLRRRHCHPHRHHAL
jgi:hypothetical protein